MNMPGFNAEASLYRPSHQYPTAEAFDGASQIVPQLTGLRCLLSPLSQYFCHQLKGVAYTRCLCSLCGGALYGGFCFFDTLQQPP
jgi:hypothetical protein